MDTFSIEVMIAKLDLIQADMENDASEFDGKPFNGENVGEYFGNQGAAIAALSDFITIILKDELKSKFNRRTQ